MVNGIGKIFDTNLKINLNLNVAKPIKLFGDTGEGLKLKPISFGPSFDITTKQGLVEPLKPSGKIKNVKKKILEREGLKGADDTTRRVAQVMNGTDVLQASGLAQPTGSKVRAVMKDAAAGLESRVANASIFSGREFQVAFVDSQGTMSQRTFRNQDEAKAFRSKLQAAGLTSEISVPREIRI